MATGWHAAVSTRPGPWSAGLAHRTGLSSAVRDVLAECGLRGGPSPVRNYLSDLLDLVWNGKIDPGKVCDLVLPFDQVAQGYRRMDERRAIKVLLFP